MAEKNISFEEKIENAKKILEELSNPELPLDKGVEHYKNGMKLLTEATKILEEAKLVYEEAEDE
ncbi:MAG: exodeoxyribonuclease VII small subunit [Campylobacterales bacterium]|nr:exodeoxyribonuclease VII small subunit [Campylobacterales bacterium]